MSPEVTLFTAALGLSSPWRVVKVEFDAPAKRLDLYVDFPSGSRFACPDCGKDCPVYDSDADRTWRHLNFFEHQTFLHARFPRVQCDTCGVRTIEGSWARPGSGFTLLFEAFALLLCRQMPIHAAATLLGEHDTRLWRHIGHYVDQALAQRDFQAVHSVNVDETARHPGQDYVTLFVDGATKSVLLVTEGKDSAAVTAFYHELSAKGGTPEQIETFTMDMSPAFESGVTFRFPKALQVVDRFHVMQIASKAVDKIRGSESKDAHKHEVLKKTRFLWLKNPEHLKPLQRQELDALCASHPEFRTVQAYQSKMALRKLWEQPNKESAIAYLRDWCAKSQDILPAVVGTVRKQAERILNYFDAGKTTNALMEGINSIVQATKARARGYRSDKYLKWAIYLTVGKLNMQLPTLNSE